MKVYHILTVTLFSEFVILILCSLILIAQRVYSFFKRKSTKENKKLFSNLLIEFLKKKPQKEKEFEFHLEFSPALILSVLEEFNLRFTGVHWETVKKYIVEKKLIAFARRYAKSFFWKKRLFSARCFALYAKPQDRQHLMMLIRDKEFLVWAKACLAAMRLEDFALTEQVVDKASTVAGYGAYFLQDLLRESSKTVFEFLEKIVKKTKNIQIHKVCFEVFSYKSFSVHLPILQEYLSSQDATMRLIAVRFFVHNPQKESFSILQKAISDQNVEIRKEALIGITCFATRETLQILERALQDEEWAIRIVAARSLIKMGGKTQSILEAQTQYSNPRGYEAIRYIQQFG